MKRKIINIGTMGIAVIIMLVGVLNYNQMAKTKMKEIETEEIRTEETETKYESEQEHMEAVKVYDEFLAGDRKIEDESIYDIIIPTGEPDRRYHTEYIILDSNGDSIPELHICNARRYLICSCREDELIVLKGFFSDPWYYNLLEDGTLLFMSETGNTMGDYFCHFRLDMSGNITDELQFYWKDINENSSADREDEYVVDGETCNMEEWYAKTKEYIYMDNEGRNQICNQAEWNVLCDKR